MSLSSQHWTSNIQAVTMVPRNHTLMMRSGHCERWNFTIAKTFVKPSVERKQNWCFKLGVHGHKGSRTSSMWTLLDAIQPPWPVALCDAWRNFTVLPSNWEHVCARRRQLCFAADLNRCHEMLALDKFFKPSINSKDLRTPKRSKRSLFHCWRRVMARTANPAASVVTDGQNSFATWKEEEEWHTKISEKVGLTTCSTFNSRSLTWV